MAKPADDADSGTTPPVSRTSGYLKALKVPVVFTIVGIGLVAVYYSLYVANMADYLKGRDLRLLSTLGAQIQSSLDNHEKVLSSFANYYGGRRFADQFFCIAEKAGARSIPMFAYTTPELTARQPATGPAQPEPADCTKPVDKPGPKQSVPVRFFEGDGGPVWTRRGGPGDGSPDGDPAFRVDLSRVLAPLFTHHVNEDTFDALLLVAPSGRVIYSEGAFDLRLTSLDNLLRRQTDGTSKELTFAALGHATQALDVDISGSRYALYLQPCCIAFTDVHHTEKESGWAVAGLTASSKLRKASLAVSFSLMALTGGLILLGIFSWPFLRLALIGQAQRLRLIDVLLIGICSLLGIALVTLFVVDWYSYGRLTADVDGQLYRLAHDISERVTSEVEAASAQVESLNDWATAKILEDQARGGRPDERGSNPFKTDPDWLGEQVSAPYPFFESFAMIDAKGSQVRKWALADFRTPLVSTFSRDYFLHWVPPHQYGGVAYFLESIRSATTGSVEAVLSAPARTDSHLAVAALTIPMVSLNDAILPPGFQFAVIDAQGLVLFHSDPRHNLQEQFILETDSYPRLRSAVAARREETLDLRYFGQDHRAFVLPLREPNGATWSLVTLFDQQLVRTVNIEWLITTMLFTVIYAGLYILLCLVIVLCRPTYRAPWLWPDADKYDKHQQLTVGYGLFAFAFAGAVYSLHGPQLLAAAWTLPFIVWIATYLVLSPSAHRRRRWLFLTGEAGLGLLLLWFIRDELTLRLVAAIVVVCGIAFSSTRVRFPLPRPYVTAAILLLILTAVLPTIAFFKVAHLIQVESFIKYGQLALAQGLQHRRESRAETANPNDAAQSAIQEGWSTYDSFFYDSKVVDATAGETATTTTNDPCAPDPGHDEVSQDLPKFLESLLPYYSEASIGMRELLHDRSSDQAWAWRRNGGRLILNTPAAAGWAIGCVSSARPMLAGSGSGLVETAARGIEFGAMSAVILLAVLWIVRFVTRRIFLIDVIEPLWARQAASIPIHPGEHLYLAWRPANRGDRRIIEEGMCVVDLATVDGKVEEWFAGQHGRLEQLETGKTVVIDHLETQTGNPVFDACRLALVQDALDVQHRTVVLVSALGPTSLVNRITRVISPETPALTRQLRSLLGRFTVLDGVRFTGSSTGPVTVAAAVTGVAAADPAMAAIADDEEDADPMVRSIREEVKALAEKELARTPLDREQMFEEVGDRLENYHRGIWSSCSDAQKIVLQHLANEGLINEKNRRTVRLLLARGLIRKDPNFRFASETFRRFVLSRVRTEEVAAMEQTATSPWNAVRMPFLLTLLAISTFFFLTQRELFTTTVAVITALAGGIPALVRVVGLFDRRQGAAPAE